MQSAHQSNHSHGDLLKPLFSNALRVSFEMSDSFLLKIDREVAFLC